MNNDTPNPFHPATPTPRRATPPRPPIPPAPIAHAFGDDGGGDDDGGEDAAAEQQRRFTQRQDYLAARRNDWMKQAQVCRTTHGPGSRERIDELMRSFDAFLVGETHEMSWPDLWAFFDHLDKLGGQFGSEDEPPAPVSRPLMMLLHQLGAEAKKDVIPRIEKELVDLPSASFIFLPMRDSYPGWLFVMTFLRGFNALPEATKQRHAPFHVWIERVPVPAAS